MNNMTLDDYIKKAKKEGGAGGKRAGAKGKRTGKQALRPTKQGEAKKDAAPKAVVLEVKNLPTELSNKEFNDVFSKFGPMKKCKLFTDDFGQSKVE